MNAHTLEPGQLTLNQLAEFAKSRPQLLLSATSKQQIDASAAVIRDAVTSQQTAYGVNTGFGKLATEIISPPDIAALQMHLLHSHAAGVGPMIEDRIVDWILLLKANSLAQGYSGVQFATIQALLQCLNHQCRPQIPSQGSVGACGDLAPLAHLALTLCGEGHMRVNNEYMDATSALAAIGLSPLSLTAKEGLALINGLQVSAAFLVDALLRVQQIFSWAIVSGALCCEVLHASLDPFSERLQRMRNLPSQHHVAKQLRYWLADSTRCHNGPSKRVQEPYSVRCQPQVMGAALWQIEQVCAVAEAEMNAVSDNPTVFVDDGAIVSGGNFHGEAIAMAADNCAIAIAEIGALVERRIALLVDSHLSGLPAFLAVKPGLHSGFMMPHVTASALVSENKHLATPLSIESLPTSANQEDHVSNATAACRRLSQMVNNLERIVAIELSALTQALYLEQGPDIAPNLQTVVSALQVLQSSYADDRIISLDIDRIHHYIADVALY